MILLTQRAHKFKLNLKQLMICMNNADILCITGKKRGATTFKCTLDNKVYPPLRRSSRHKKPAGGGKGDKTATAGGGNGGKTSGGDKEFTDFF